MRENGTTPAASIIICTHNRCASLEKTLAALCGQDYPPDDFEILVVNNGSTDGTEEIVAQLRDKAPCALRSVLEPHIGLSQARNTGIKHAHGEIVAFIDDDASPCGPGWLRTLVGVFRDKNLDAAGGNALPVWPDDTPPSWLHPKLYPYLGLIDFHSPVSKQIKKPQYPYGVNIAFRKTSLERFGGFSLDLGRKGDLLLSGEETDLCCRIADSGGSIMYVAGADVFHRVARQRLNRQWFRRIARSDGISLVYFYRHSLWKRIGNALKQVLAFGWCEGARIFWTLVGRHDLAFAEELYWLTSRSYLKNSLNMQGNNEGCKSKV